MTNSEKRKKQTKTLVLGSVMTALVIILQLIGTATTFFGPFSTAVASKNFSSLKPKIAATILPGNI